MTAQQLACNGTPTYAAARVNSSNYYSAAPRTDHLGFATYDWTVTDGVT